MSSYLIHGGTPLQGSVRVGGAKNASYKLMIASLLAQGKSALLNFSHISDVELVRNVINELGATAAPYGERAYVVDPTGLDRDHLPSNYGPASRASTLLAAPLLAKFGRADLPLPGGDDIGKRPLDRHIEGLRALGAQVQLTSQRLIITASRLTGTTYRFAKNTHTGTETLLMAASIAQGTTILENAAQETEVDELIAFLNAMGARIERVAPRTIKVQGGLPLHGAIHKVMPDQNQVVSFACAALASQGDIIVENARPSDLTAFLDALQAVGGCFELGNYGIRFFWEQPLHSYQLATAPHPGFKTDWQPLWVLLMTQAHGVSTVHETVSQSRFKYVPSLQAMGAQIELFDPRVDQPDEIYNFNLNDAEANEPRAVRVTGPSRLSGGSFSITDLRHGATLLIAGIIASGTSTVIDKDHHVDRGYERIDVSLRQLGADITKLD
ncbi:MAG: UDP-N-acetylglucosamine 1-carboxyvinyltransferase [Candidatus Pacebacteria bacterium CG10_big_fil_rev_8_21_14_0_10_56_10]|nr:MAG: UDP-N-acetylglucosamine 1-carboxyvinyltransferase [Candidatus Pacebacteria bacterium CG10_big_fil_rev_8_21_14_0_10_56_10]